MNFNQLGVQLNMTRNGARLLVLRNKAKLKKYLIIKNKKIVGVDDDSLEAIRNLTQRHTDIAYKRDKDIELYKVQIDNLERLILEKDKSFDLVKSELDKARAELDYYRSLGFFQRLLGYKPNNK